MHPDEDQIMGKQEQDQRAAWKEVYGIWPVIDMQT
jgi:hypothetical protein